MSPERFTTAADVYNDALATIASLLAVDWHILAGISCSALQTATFQVPAPASHLPALANCVPTNVEPLRMPWQVNSVANALSSIDELCLKLAMPSD